MKYLVMESKSEKQTKQIGEILAQEINNRRYLSEKKDALVVGLSGSLGAGKTTFIQGMAAGLGIKNRITSPTFVIMKKFRIKAPDSDKMIFDFFYHFDFYRLNSKKDLKIINLESVLRDKRNLVAVEWPNKIRGFLSGLSPRDERLPFNFIKIELIFKSQKERTIKMFFK